MRALSFFPPSSQTAIGFSLILVTSSPTGRKDEIQIPDDREFGAQLVGGTIMFPGHLRLLFGL